MPDGTTYKEQVSDAIARLTGKRTPRCPVPGCTLRIRYRAVTPDEARRLVALAHDHTRHGTEK
ncbi:hypothetical protein ABZS81_02250 [Streptomyces sp. NPDC005318]|uniref:hypothetical protein n=1 Tax=Streptomyces sp. NPDC005318 TaxID=3157031 RepID=UPI0033AE4B44